MNRFQQFIKEKQYLQNVSPRTIEWHQQSLKWLGIEEPSEEDLKAAVLRMREAGLKPSSVNCRLRSINAYLKWTGSVLKVPKLKEPSLTLPVFSQQDIQKFMAWKSLPPPKARMRVLTHRGGQNHQKEARRRRRYGGTLAREL
jgi:integrase/recombinase XerD